MKSKASFDVAIVGGGIAGCHLAQLLAAGGLNAALIDQHPLAQSGPQWINAVPLWMFDEARLARPQDKELFDLNERFIIRSPDRAHRITIEDTGVADVDMGLLGARLKNMFAAKAGENKFIKAQITHAQYDKFNRLVRIFGQDSSNNQISIRAHVFVDASGIKAVLRKTHPLASKLWSLLERADICTASQQTFELKDRAGAQTFLEKNNLVAGDVLADIGVVGGFSLFRVQIDKNLNHVSILSGVRALKKYPGAQSLINNFISANNWIGKSFIKGSGAIPLNAPYKSLVVPGLALLGDAASQVYASHASGIGMGLIAARYLADTMIAAFNKSMDLGCAESIKDYQINIHRHYYDRLYSSERFRRFSQSLSAKSSSRLIACQLISPELCLRTLDQQRPTVSASDVKHFALGVLKSPRSFAAIMPVLMRSMVGGIFT